MENNSISVNMEHLLESFLGDTPDLAEKTEANIPVSVNNFESNSNISNCLTKFMIDRLKSGRIGKEDVFKMLDASVCLGLHFVKAATNLSNSNHRKISALVFYMMEQYSHYLTRSELSNIVYYCQSRRSILSKLCNECREYVSDSTFADVVVSRFCNFIMERYPFYEIEEKGIFLTVIASIVSINSKSGLNVYGWFDNEQPRSAQLEIKAKSKNLKPKSKSSINKDNENVNGNDNNNNNDDDDDDDKNGKKNNSENEKDSQENKKEKETRKESKDKDKGKDETDTAVVTTNKSENENDKMEDDWMDDESELFNFNERLYKAFWSVQDVLCNPELLCGKDKKRRDSIFLKFRNNLYYVLSEFSENGVSNEEAKVHFKTRQDESSDYQCKYLTSKKLFNLQLKDPSLRRQMLIQIMIFLKPHTIDVEATKLRNVKGKEEERQWFLEAYRIAGNQLSMIPPDGQRLASFINQALKQESLWLSWKYTKKDKCRSLEKKGKKESKTSNDKNDTSNDSSHKSKLARKLVNSNDSNNDNDNDNDNNNSGNNNDEPPRKRQRQSKIPLMGSNQLAKLWQSRPECFNPNSINYDNCTQTRNRIRAANAHWNQNNDINVESAAPKNDKFYCGLMDFPRRRPLIVPTTQNKGMDWLTTRIQGRNDALETSLNKLKSAVKHNIEVNKNLRNALKNPKLEFETLRMLRGCDYETFCDTGVLVEPHHKAPITWKDVSFLWKVTEKTMDVESFIPNEKAKTKAKAKEREREKEKEKNMSKEKEKDKEKEKEKVHKDTNGDHPSDKNDNSGSSRNGHDISMKDKNEKEKEKEREATEKREKDKGGAGVNNKSKDSSSNSSTNGHSPSKTKGRSRNSSHREFIMPEKAKTFSTSHNPNGHNNNSNNNNSNISNNHNNHNNNKNDSNHHRNHSSNENHRNGIHNNGSNNNNSNNNSNSNSSNNNKYHTNSGKLTVSIDNGSTTNINTHSSQKQRTFINSTQQILSNGSQSGTNSRQYRGFNGNQGHDNRNRNNHHNRRQSGKNWRKK